MRCAYAQRSRVAIVDAQSIQELNCEHRGKDTPTDVLFSIDSFIFPSSIVNNHMAHESQSIRHKIEEEIVLLFIQRLLHLLGFNHEVDSVYMADKEEA